LKNIWSCEENSIYFVKIFIKKGQSGSIAKQLVINCSEAKNKNSNTLSLTGSKDRFLAPQQIVIARNAEKSVITYQIL